MIRRSNGALAAVLGAWVLSAQLGCSSSDPNQSVDPNAGAAGGSVSNAGAGTAAAGSTSSVGGTGSLPSGGAAANMAGNPSVGGSSAAGGSFGGASTGGASTQAGMGGGGVAGTASGATGGGGATGGSGGSTGGGLVPLDPSLLSRCTGTNPITCTFDAPNGDYDLSVEVGDTASAATSQVSAETRHYAGPAVATAAGSYSLQSLTVNVRPEKHDGGQSAPGDVLNVLIGGASPKLHGIGFRAAPSAVTIFIASDSTVCDWVSTNTSAVGPDQTGWGQELSMYLKPGIAIANYADSGETASTFYTKFFPPARTAMKAGDYLFIQFGHNDQKVPADVTNYKANLLKYVTDARAKNVTPVIFTPVSRSSGSAADPGFAGLDQDARDLAAQQNVALVDLTVLSRAYYATVPSKSALFIDGTHFHEGGAIGVAGVVATALKGSSLGLKDFVK